MLRVSGLEVRQSRAATHADFFEQQMLLRAKYRRLFGLASGHHSALTQRPLAQARLPVNLGPPQVLSLRSHECAGCLFLHV